MQSLQTTSLFFTGSFVLRQSVHIQFALPGHGTVFCQLLSRELDFQTIRLTTAHHPPFPQAIIPLDPSFTACSCVFPGRRYSDPLHDSQLETRNDFEHDDNFEHDFDNFDGGWLEHDP